MAHQEQHGKMITIHQKKRQKKSRYMNGKMKYM